MTQIVGDFWGCHKLRLVVMYELFLFLKRFAEKQYDLMRKKCETRQKNAKKMREMKYEVFCDFMREPTRPSRVESCNTPKNFEQFYAHGTKNVLDVQN